MFALLHKPSFRQSSSLVIAGAVSLLSLAHVANAAPFDPRVVSADATWVVHVDLEEAVHSTLGQFVLQNADELGIDLSKLDEAKAQLGIDPLEAIFGMTVYGVGEVGDNPVVVITGAEALSAVLDNMAKSEDAPIEPIEIGRATGYQIGGDWVVAVGDGPGVGNSRIVAAEGVEALQDALRVLVGGARSKKGADGARPQDGSWLFINAATDLPNGVNMDDNPVVARIAGSVSHVVVDLGEQADDVYISVQAATNRWKKRRRSCRCCRGLLRWVGLSRSRRRRATASGRTLLHCWAGCRWAQMMGLLA